MRGKPNLHWLLFLCLWGCSPAVPPRPALVPPHTPAPLTIGDSATESYCIPALLKVFFTTPSGTCSQLFLFDENLQDVWAFPAAGFGVHNPKTGSHDSVLFDRDWNIFRLFYNEERLCRYNTGPGYAFAPNIDRAENVYFLVADTLEQAQAGIGDLGILLCPEDVVIKPELINSVGRAHGGITSFGIAKAGYPLAFTTLDGWLFWTYLSATESAPILDTGIRDADDIDIDENGTLIVWVDVRQNRLFLSGFWNFDNPCPLFIANPPEGLLSGPRFKGSAPDYITYVSTPADGINYRFAYDLCLGLTRTLAAIGHR